MTSNVAEGWGLPADRHFFRNHTSLCRKWGFFYGKHHPDSVATNEDCAICRRKPDAGKE